MNRNILAIDLGYGAVKVAYRTSYGELRYQKIITAIARTEKKDVCNTKDEITYEYENVSYYIGQNALYLPPKQIINVVDYKSFRLISPIIISYYLNLIQSSENIKFDAIAVGLSLAYENESADYLQYLKSKLGLEVIVLPQGISCKFAVEKYGLDPTDESIATDVKLDNYIGVDLGFNTVDVFKVIGGKSSTDTSKGYEKLGVIDIAEKLNKYVTQKYGIELSTQNYKTILEVGSFHYMGQRINLINEIHDLTVDYLIHVVNVIQEDYFESIKMVKRLIMVGGVLI